MPPPSLLGPAARNGRALLQSSARLRTCPNRSYALRPRWASSGSTSSSSASSSSSSSSSGAPPPRYKSMQDVYKQRNRTLLMYTSAVFITTLGISYAAVPLYRAFCAATGYSGVPTTSSKTSATGRFEASRLTISPSSERKIKVNFNSETSISLPWKFTPQQKFVVLKPGETSLAFYTAKNKSDKDIIGIATYNVLPEKVAPYFAKIECFCFEEQKLLAGEEVDMPLFFFIDKDFLDDPSMADVQDIVLSYTFFKARRNEQGHLEPDTDRATFNASMGWSDYEHAPVKQPPVKQVQE